MVDVVNLQDHIEKNGLNFKKLFKTILTGSTSLFLGLLWSSLFSEILLTFMPEGTNLIQKISIDIFVTVILVIFVYLLWRKR